MSRTPMPIGWRKRAYNAYCQIKFIAAMEADEVFDDLELEEELGRIHIRIGQRLQNEGIMDEHCKYIPEKKE